MIGGKVPLALITNANPAYLRSDLGDLTALTKSIKKDGLHGPILCDSTYLILDGARRVEALKKLGAKEVWCLATDSWETLHAQFLEAAKRHATDDFLPKSYLDILNLSPSLMDLKAVHSRRLAAQNRGKVAKGLKPSAYRQASFPTFLSEAFGIGDTAAKELMAASGKLAAERFKGNTEAIKRAHAGVQEAEDKKYAPTSIRNIVAHAIDPSVPLVGRAGYAEGRKQKASPIYKDMHPAALLGQVNTITRILTTIENTTAAVPAEGDLSNRHTTENIQTWLKQISRINTTLRRLKRRLTESQMERENHDGQEDGSGAGE